MAKKHSLIANRRGIVKNFMEMEKSVFNTEELFENRRRGISYSSIGKKLGVDNTKEVVKIFKAIQECDPSLLSFKCYR